MLRFDAPVLLLGHGPIADGAVQAGLARCAHIVAADGGADRALALGLTPDAIIGDMDSAQSLDHWRASGVPIHRDGDQNTTDFEKCLSLIAAPRILALGFSAGQADHYLANAAKLVSRAQHNVILLDDTDIAFACPDELTLDLAPNTRVSLFPFALVSATSTGLRWPLDGLPLAPLGQIATSNRALGRVQISEGQGLWVILPAHALPVLWSSPGSVHEQ